MFDFFKTNNTIVDTHTPIEDVDERPKETPVMPKEEQKQEEQVEEPKPEEPRRQRRARKER